MRLENPLLLSLGESRVKRKKLDRLSRIKLQQAALLHPMSESNLPFRWEEGEDVTTRFLQQRPHRLPQTIIVATGERLIAKVS